jgi:hypothetical protein
MAIESTKVASALKLTMKVGIDEKGKNKVVTKILRNLKVTAFETDNYYIRMDNYIV